MHWSRFLRTVWATTVFAGVALSSPAHAQVVRGTVLDASQRAVPGVVVMLLDSADAVVARALSSDAGEFRVVAPGSGAYRLRALRIGFQPTTTPPMALVTGTVRAETVVMDGVRVLLDAIRIVDRGVCGRQRASDNDAIFSAWDQAMTSIAATTLTSSGRGLTATTMQLERVLESDGRRVREQTASVRTEFVKQPWRSMAPDSLRQHGYTAVDASGVTTFYAPGLEVLVSPHFLEDHCLRLISATDTSEVGVAFEPTNARRSKSEIRGTLWMSRASAELRRLDFQFTDVPRFTARVVDGSPVAGGSMRFTRLDGGAVLVSAWDIRMPQLVKETARSATVRVANVAVSGGELLVLRRGADTLYKRAPLAVRGTVRDSVSGRAVAAATVSLLGTPLSTRSDAAGAFVLADVLPGEYTIAVRTPSLDSISTASASTLLVADGMASVALKVPSASQLARSLCGPALSGAAATGKGGVLGVVRHAGDTIGVGQVKVVADWFDTVVRGSTVVREGRRLETRTDASGAYRLCGVPTEAALTIRAMPDNARAQTATARLAPDQRFATVPLTIDRTRPATSTLSGTVVADSSFAPVADADVLIPALSLNARTNARGEFTLSEIPAGTHEVTVRRVGYGALVSTLTFAPNETEERRMVLRQLTVLDSVEVIATRIDPGLRDFEDNRRLGLGHFMTRDELAKIGGRRLGDVMSMTPGAGVVRGRSGAWMMSKRYVVPIGAVGGGSGGTDAIWRPSASDRFRGLVAGCYAQVYMDNKLMNPERPTEPFDINVVPAEQIEALEWYASPAQTPARYTNLNSVCGVLVIHTRRPDAVPKP